MYELKADTNRVLGLEGLRTGYRDKVVIDGISLDVAPGEIIALIGPNGAGKSTILKSISAQIPLLGGKVFLGDTELRAQAAMERAKYEAVVLTDRIKPELMTVRDVVEMGRFPYTDSVGRMTDQDREEVNHAMDLMEIRELSERNYNEMSDGQKQRVLIARAIAQTPQLMLLDEPTSYLDIRYKLALLRTLQQLVAERNLTVIATLHEVELALATADRILCIRDGRAFYLGTPEEIQENGVLAELFELDPKDTYATAIYPWLVKA